LPFEIKAERILELNAKWLIQARFSAAGLVEGGTYTFVVALPGSVTHFTSRVEHRLSATVFIELPQELHQAGFRDSVRTQIQANHAGALVDCTHPRLSEELLDRPLLDLSARGFAFAVEPESDLLFPGDRLGFVRIRFQDEIFESRGVIRRIAPYDDAGVYSCGVEITEFAEPSQELRWREQVFRYMHPRAVVVEPAVAARKAWHVLADSGYIRLWTPDESRERLEVEYARTWSQAARGDGHLMLVERRGETAGTLAGSVLLPRTWLVHQLGVTERERGGLGTFMSLAYELYSGLMFMFQHQLTADYFVIYAERDTSWNEALYGNFAAQCPDQSALAHDDNRVFRRVIGSPVSTIIPMDPALQVTVADHESLPAVSRALQASSSPVVYDALAYAPEDLALLVFSKQRRELGFERGRGIYLAHEHGVPVAALIADSGEEGVNVFGLMNTCFIVGLTPRPVSPAAKAALLGRAERHFNELEKRYFVFFDDADADPAFVTLCGFEFISEGMRFIAHKRVVPAWLSYLANVLSLRQAAEGGAP
jgi:hypothetical protein